MRINNFLRELFEKEDKIYRLAIRKKSDESDAFFLKNDFTFQILENESKMCWKADPFLFEYNGETYVFYELYEYFRRRGVIAYSKICDDDKGLWLTKPRTVLKVKTHLSFPNIFKFGSEIYMIPETCNQNNICLYKCIKFPDKWEKAETLLTEVYACDTIFLKDEENGKYYLLTSHMDKAPRNGRIPSCYVYNKLYQLADNGLKVINRSGWNLTEGDDGVRSGGIVTLKSGDNNYTIRVGQNCKNGEYGRDLVLWEVVNYFPYQEKKIKCVSLETFQDHIFSGEKFVGVHTYTTTCRYEMIDISTYQELPIYVRISLFVNHCYAYLVKKIGRLLCSKEKLKNY